MLDDARFWILDSRCWERHLIPCPSPKGEGGGDSLSRWSLTPVVTAPFLFRSHETTQQTSGYKDSQIKKFNQMYEKLVEADTEADRTVNAFHYTERELAEFRTYKILAETDEAKRWIAMRFKRASKDFSNEEIERFTHMQQVLGAFNALLDDGIDIHLILPGFSDIEMMELSQYQEIVASEEVRNYRQTLNSNGK